MNKQTKLAVLASGNASNLDAIQISCINGDLNCVVNVIITNNSNANVIEKANNLNIPIYIINSKKFSYPDNEILNVLNKYSCDLVVLSGYMKKISSNIISQYNIINTHPSLLPAYGGKGMYGRNVHESVIKNKESKSGITIHYVNENYDDGKIIFQKSLNILKNETIDSLETKIKKLEYNSIVKAIQLCLK